MELGAQMVVAAASREQKAAIATIQIVLENEKNYLEKSWKVFHNSDNVHILKNI